MKIVYVDMDSVLVNFQSGIDALTEEQRLAFKDDLDDVPGIFSMMKPVDGAGEFKGEHIHFLTKPFRGWDDVLSYLIPNANQ